jgi:hypothetical protein
LIATPADPESTMLEIRWNDVPAPCESLPVALRNLLVACGVERSYEELVAVLGLGSAFVAAPGECPRLWPTYARDLSLTLPTVQCPTPVADLYGLRLRDLHPSDAAARLDQSAEFPQHFVDSYVPLMLRALVAGQPLLVWRGWPPPAEREWGLVTEAVGQELRGYTAGFGDKCVPLTSAAHQVYVVEGGPTPAWQAPDAQALVRAAAGAARRFWQAPASDRLGLQFGEQALATWLELVGEHASCPICEDATSRCLQQQLRKLNSTRRAQDDWLATIRSQTASGVLRNRTRMWSEANARLREQVTVLRWMLAEDPTEVGQTGEVTREMAAKILQVPRPPLRMRSEIARSIVELYATEQAVLESLVGEG